MANIEPLPATMEEIGRLCAAWSMLELRTEQTIWGILEVEDKIGPIITSRLDMRGRWQLILEWAPRKHSLTEVQELRTIDADVATVNVDRNIIVHGLIHASGRQKQPTPTTGIPAEDVDFSRVPCWTIARGPQAGKNFKVSKTAVEVVRTNIQNIGKRVFKFNERFGYMKTVTPQPDYEFDWPKPIP
jgi:hypothetical protein